MRTLVLPLRLCALIGLVLSPLAAHASSPFDYEHWRRDHPRPAGKRLALNVGEPRTVSMGYIVENDRPYRQEVVDSMKVIIRQVQTFYAEQMQAHGYGNKTFRIETDAQGEPLVHRDMAYPGIRVNVFETENGFATAHNSNKRRGGAAISASALSFHTVAHELGHAFGLPHDFRDDAYIMSYGGRSRSRSRLSACAAEFLSVHPFFNSSIPLESTDRTLKRISPTEYPAGSKNVSIRFKASDSVGLHQAILLANTRFGADEGLEVQTCRGLGKKKEAIVEFEYDVTRPSEIPGGHFVGILVVGVHGDTNARSFTIFEPLPYKIATLRHTDFYAQSLSFSSDGTLLAVGVESGVILWDVRSRQQIATLDGASWRGLSFSPDGTLLAVGDESGVILWDVRSRQQIATLDGAWPGGLSFSPDGTLLAVGDESGVTLWDVRSRQQIATLDGASRPGLSFSPDGTLLAVGDESGVTLWDVRSRQQIATLEDEGLVIYPSFSPDGTLLAAQSRFLEILLWDVRSRQQIATLETTPVVSPWEDWVLRGGPGVSFSSDSALLATTGGTMRTTVWDVGSRQQVAILPGEKAASFSPDGTLLATLGESETTLFDVSELAGGLMPHSLTKVSGDRRRGQASTQLVTSLVVSVLDQNGSPLPGVKVSFSASAGGGLLSSAIAPTLCAVESSTSSTTVTTDANGRAAVRLTLGSELGTNTVVATVAGLEPVTFTATAFEQVTPRRLTKACGDGQEGLVNKQLDEPFVVLVRDKYGSAMAGVVVSFAATAGGGTLSSTTATTNANGRAATWLTLGSDEGTNTVQAVVEGLSPVTFTATGEKSALASMFDAFGSGKLAALPDRTQLLQNAPNPFNSQTVLSYFLREPGLVRLEVFALTGQRVAVLQQGPQQAGYHRLHWDGRDAAGHPVASGAYLYRLATEEAVLTRKLILLR